MKKSSSLFLSTLFVVLIGLTVSLCSGCLFNSWNTKSSENQLNSNETKKNWRIQSFETGQKENISSIYAYDEKNIYGIGYGKIHSTFFKSSDQGKSWKRLSSIENFNVNNTFFISSEQGFITVSKITIPANNQTESRIMKTDDGGLSWKTLFTSTETILNKLVFDSNGNGLVIGQTKILGSQNTTNIILLSKDKGQNWKQILNSSATNILTSDGLVIEGIIDALFSKSNEIVVLSGNGKILKTADEGISWRLTDEFKDEQPQTFVNRFGELENGDFWLAGGTMSIEGKWSVVAFKGEGEWNKTTLNNYYFYDVKFLSDREILACGFLHNIPKSDGAKEFYKGVIMYSANGGKNWESLYESETTQKYYSIFNVSKSNFLVFGEKGAGIILNKS